MFPVKHPPNTSRHRVRTVITVPGASPWPLLTALGGTDLWVQGLSYTELNPGRELCRSDGEVRTFTDHDQRVSVAKVSRAEVPAAADIPRDTEERRPLVCARWSAPVGLRPLVCARWSAPVSLGAERRHLKTTAADGPSVVSR
ncbi:hypothetical protein GCM10022224_080740 [Nonomuraea antimicrobica]|uniref:Uncharacterized protein n=1 Tax=Nonomuraea antimicrobica TaxID=561173 RepID=A0ABP7DDH7_9ACTN